MLQQGNELSIEEERTEELVKCEDVIGRYKECSTQLDTNNHVSTIMDWAQAAGKATGQYVAS